MIKVEELVRRYGETTAVGGISFEIPAREVVGFLGPNGAGKTTTLKVLTGYLYPTSGKVTIAGLDVSERSLDCRRSVGYLPENNPLYEEMEVVECLEWCARMRGLDASRAGRAIQSAVERCGLGAVVGKDIGQLSKGYRQRVGLAAAILHDPPILLLDEPTSGLDPNQAAEVRGLIAELRKEKTVLLSSHILSEVKASCDRVIIIHQGRIAAQGKPSELEAAGSAGQRLRLVLKADAEDPNIERALQGLPGVASVARERADGELAFLVAGQAEAGDLRSAVFGLAAERRWPLLELFREGASLEEVFRRLTA
ncbi:MAG: ATP-binding cassette domain-containing protein [Elusimicrobia bacterium]|nr:ATP-binding cassette domain-containing protein [Elusimicrobiota bacterium]